MERSKIQRLFDACCSSFTKEEVPTYQSIQWIRSILDTLEAIDVGIDEFGNSSQELISGMGIEHMTYIHIYESQDFSIGVFCLPAGGKMPLHDHPKMTVLSKVLYGSVYCRAYDWARSGTSEGKSIGVAGLAMDEVLKAPHEATVLYPNSGGNLHSFTALTPCAILDVLAPPYSDEQGRSSTYYSELPIPSLPGYAILQEKDLPEDLVCVGAPYLGPHLQLDQFDH